MPTFIDKKDELDSYLLHFECYTENASWEKYTWAVKLSALLIGRAMDVYTRISDTDANDYDKVKKALLTRYNYKEDGYQKDSGRSSLRLKKRQTSSSPFKELPSHVVRTFRKQFWRIRSSSGSDSQGTVYEPLFWN